MTELYAEEIFTPRGVFWVSFNQKGIYEIFFPGSEIKETFLQKKMPWLQFSEDLNRYFLGEIVDWRKYPLDCSGYRAFTDILLREVRSIPHGTVCTYREMAERSGSPRAWRAAGQALAVNRHPVIVPCHRVVGSGGKLGGFSGPPGWKEMLLELEGVVV